MQSLLSPRLPIISTDYQPTRQRCRARERRGGGQLDQPGLESLKFKFISCSGSIRPGVSKRGTLSKPHDSDSRPMW